MRLLIHSFSSTTDALNRLKPGFEAPVCIVTSFGTDPSEPNRNRTILCGLIRDIDNPMATRFEFAFSKSIH